MKFDYNEIFQNKQWNDFGYFQWYNDIFIGLYCSVCGGILDTSNASIFWRSRYIGGKYLRMSLRNISCYPNKRKFLGTLKHHKGNKNLDFYYWAQGNFPNGMFSWWGYVSNWRNYVVSELQILGLRKSSLGYWL